MITVGSLFSGIGGIELGLERTGGFEVRFQVEIDDYCQRVLAKHWPDVQRFRDVREVGKHNLSPVDLICGGFPCQPHSVAGKRRGAEDDRNLWPEYRRIVAELRPRYVLAENVPGIVTTYIDTVLSELESEGYTCWPFNLPACAFDAPHRRERIFILAHSERLRMERVCTRHGNLKGQWETKAKRCQNGIGITLGSETIGGLCPSRWRFEPRMDRMAHGLPGTMDRLKALGNSVVPQVAQWIGERILEAEQAFKDKPNERLQL